MKEWLVAHGWDNLFLDIDPDSGLVVGQRWREELKKNARTCKAVIFLVSQDLLDSSFCRTEYELANNGDRVLLGVKIEDIKNSHIPQSFEWQSCDLKSGKSYKEFKINPPPTYNQKIVKFSIEGLKNLKRGLIKAGLNNIEVTSFPWPHKNFKYESDGITPRIPYRGLSAIESVDAGVFFGRDADIVRFYDLLLSLRKKASKKIIVILGASGSGKSSFLKAGIIPRLERFGGGFYALPVIRPRRDPIHGKQGLLYSINQALAELGQNYTRADIDEDFESGKLINKLSSIAKILKKENPEKLTAPTIIIAIDQAEELYNQSKNITCPNITQEVLFLNQIADFLNKNLHLIIILTIRSDSHESLQTCSILSNFHQTPYNLPPIKNYLYKEIVEGPARRNDYPLIIDPKLTEELLNKAKGKDALPLLSFTIQRLYLKYGASREINIKNYKHYGELDGIIEEAIKIAFQDPSTNPIIPKNKEIREKLLKSVFISHLVGINEEDKPIRKIALRSKLDEKSYGMIDRLIGIRLLVEDKSSSTKDSTIEIAHESLLNHWINFKRWFALEREDIKSFQILAESSNRWSINDNTKEWLDHNGTRLQEVIKLSKMKNFKKKCEGEISNYIKACVKNESKKKKNINIVILIFIIVVLSFLSFITYRGQTNSKQISRINSGYTNLLIERGFNISAIKSAILSAKSTYFSPADDSSSIGLIDAIQSLKEIFSTHFDDPILGVIYYSNGDRIIEISTKTIKVINIKNNSIVKTINSDIPINLFKFSHKRNKLIVTDTKNGYIRSINFNNDKYSINKLQIKDRVNQVEFISNSDSVAILGNSNIIKLNIMKYNIDNKPFEIKFKFEPNSIIDISSDGKFLSIYSKNHCYIYNIENDFKFLIKELCLTNPSIVTKDKNMMYFDVKDQITLKSFKSTTNNKVARLIDGKYSSFKVSNNHKYLLAFYKNQYLKLIKLNEINDDLQSVRISKFSNNAQFSHNGKYVVYWYTPNNKEPVIHDFKDTGAFKIKDVEDSVLEEINFKHGESLNGIKFSKNNENIVSWSGNLIKVWDLKKRKTIFYLETKFLIAGVEISPTADTVTYWNKEGFVKTFKTIKNSLKVDSNIGFKISQVRSISNNSFIISNENNTKIQKIELSIDEKNKEKKIINYKSNYNSLSRKHQNTKPVEETYFSNVLDSSQPEITLTQDSKYLIIWRLNNSIVIKDMIKDKEVFSFKINTTDSKLFFLKDSHFMYYNNYIVSSDGITIKIWDIKKGSLKSEYEIESGLKLKGQFISSNNKYLIVWYMSNLTTSYSNVNNTKKSEHNIKSIIYIYNLESVGDIKTFMHDGPVDPPIITSDGLSLISWEDKIIRITELSEKVKHFQLEHSMNVWSAKLSNNDKLILSSSSESPVINKNFVDTSVHLWDRNSHDKISKPKRVDFSISGIEILEGQNRALLWGSGGKLLIWDIDKNKINYKLTLKIKSDIKKIVSFDKRMVAFFAKDLVYLWDTRTYKIIDTIAHDSKVKKVIFSNNNRYMLTLTEKNRIKILDYHWGINPKARRDLGLSTLINEICYSANSFLIGDNRIITQEDINALPILDEKLTEKVCENIN